MSDKQDTFIEHILAENERLQAALRFAQIGTWELDIVNKQVHWDERCKQLYGFSKEDTVTYEEVLTYIHPLDAERVREAVQSALNPQSDGAYDIQFRTIGAEDGQLRWIHCKGQTYFNKTGEAYRFTGIAQNITELIESREQAETSDHLAALALEGANAGRFTVRLEDNHVDHSTILAHILTGNERIVNRATLVEHVHQDDRGIRDEAYQQAEKTGKLRYQARFVWDDGSIHWVRVIGQYQYDANGKPYQFSGIAQNIDQEVEARLKLEESELFVRSVMQNSPVAKLVVVGEQMTISIVNDTMFQLLGRNDSIIGKTLPEALPEFISTPFIDRLKQTFKSGEIFYKPEERIELVRHGVPYTGYYNYIYKPLRNTTGVIYGVLVTATEVTQQVVSRQQVEEAESLMRGAVELAQLGTWIVDPLTGQVLHSERMAEWLGIESGVTHLDNVYPLVFTQDQERVRAALELAWKPESGGIFDLEYMIVNRLTSRKYIIHAQARTTFTEKGVPIKMTGTAQDVTADRSLQLALQQQVQQSTEELAASNEELAAANEELAATNEELATTNEELTESNELLARSNDNLEKFAYIASHDLQEPLRKIQSFGDLLKKEHGSVLGNGLHILERMQSAANRMSILIKDLLTFSRIVPNKEVLTTVSLNELFTSVLAELELRIEETRAQIQIDPLPEISGDVSQLSQLFQNLLSNALKFHKQGIPPVIQVHYKQIDFSDLPLIAKVSRQSTDYHQIDVIDNGIGFEQEYASRIFQIFQRLHSRIEYAGTGIGLAICEKVVMNHGGAIIATSEPGKGATFTVFLPQA
ncbi:PAS domain-containing protein [Xanthocytophaga flava]|uniref:PAS domain-containing protein n=1 Tax=Xanthocytophaga flava TaxID=3048013 RepID=UPI0028D1B71D|nr:PAS domain-containing protein [Xanthocytophaga flavus]MDJ1470787.1 PAS domain-containing protein [Xanthocytophaga flavus]